jgi:hypothetical protein
MRRKDHKVGDKLVLNKRTLTKQWVVAWLNRSGNLQKQETYRIAAIATTDSKEFWPPVKPSVMLEGKSGWFSLEFFKTAP